MAQSNRPLAVVTGASSGIGFELAKCCASNGYDLIVAADEPLDTAVRQLQGMGAEVRSLVVDLSTVNGVEELCDFIGERPVDALLANAGRGLGNGFLDQAPDDWQHVIQTNITGTLYLIHNVARDMVDRREGKILITGSIAGFMPGSYQAVYNGSKAFLDSFSFALRHELKETGVSVTCLMPGATETEFFERADMMDTKVGVSEKMPASEVAQMGFDAMIAGKGEVITGWMNKLRAAMGSILPADITAEMHTKMAKPGTAGQAKRAS